MILAVLIAAETTFMTLIPREPCQVVTDQGSCTVFRDQECKFALPSGIHHIQIKECIETAADVESGKRYRIARNISFGEVSYPLLGGLGTLVGTPLLLVGISNGSAKLDIIGAAVILGGLFAGIALSTPPTRVGWIEGERSRAVADTAVPVVIP
jgi:hypothetical protein